MPSARHEGPIVPGAERRYDIDALRVGAFGLLILYHCGMFYVSGWGWHVKSQYQSDWLQVPMLFVNQWRIPLLFLASGLAIRLVWDRYSVRRLAARRTFRLLLPLVFGMAFIVAPQCYYEALGKGLIEPGFMSFMKNYLTFQDFPGEAWGGEEQIVWTWNHLWYLPYVWFYTMLLLPVYGLLAGPVARLRAAFVSLRGWRLVLLPVLPLMFWGSVVYPRFPYISHAFFDDWYAHAMYGTIFFYGFLIGRDDGFWEELRRLRRPLLIAAAILYVCVLARNAWLPEDTSGWLEALSLAITYLNRWLWLLTVMAWAFAYLNRPSRRLAYATEAVYPWYILHQTVIIVAGVNLARLSLGPVLEPLLVVAMTIAACFLLHEFVIRRSRWLRPFFGLSAGSSASRSSSA